MERTPERPDVSVVIPAFCAEGLLTRSVGTALAQRGVTVEVIVVDDASTDGTAAEGALLASAHPQVRLLRLSENGGPSAARNAALEAARGTWVAVLDADDGMTATRLRGMVDLAGRAGADLVLGNLLEVAPDGTPLSGVPFCPLGARPRELSPADFLAGNAGAPGERSLGYLKPLMRRAFVEEHRLRYDPELRNGEDFHFVLAAYAAGARVWLSPEPAYRYTRRAGSVSHRAAPGHIAALLAADRRAEDAFAARPDLRRLLRRRRTALARMMTAETVLQSLRRGAPGPAAAAIARHPAALPRVALQLREAASRRLVGRPAPPRRAGRLAMERDDT